MHANMASRDPNGDDDDDDGFRKLPLTQLEPRLGRAFGTVI